MYVVGKRKSSGPIEKRQQEQNWVLGSKGGGGWGGGEKPKRNFADKGKKADLMKKNRKKGPLKN